MSIIDTILPKPRLLDPTGDPIVLVDRNAIEYSKFDAQPEIIDTITYPEFTNANVSNGNLIENVIWADGRTSFWSLRDFLYGDLKISANDYLKVADNNGVVSLSTGSASLYYELTEIIFDYFKWLHTLDESTLSTGQLIDLEMSKWFSDLWATASNAISDPSLMAVGVITGYHRFRPGSTTYNWNAGLRLPGYSYVHPMGRWLDYIRIFHSEYYDRCYIPLSGTYADSGHGVGLTGLFKLSRNHFDVTVSYSSGGTHVVDLPIASFKYLDITASPAQVHDGPKLISIPTLRSLLLSKAVADADKLVLRYNSNGQYHLLSALFAPGWQDTQFYNGTGAEMYSGGHDWKTSQIVYPFTAEIINQPNDDVSNVMMIDDVHYANGVVQLNTKLIGRIMASESEDAYSYEFYTNDIKGYDIFVPAGTPGLNHIGIDYTVVPDGALDTTNFHVVHPLKNVEVDRSAPKGPFNEVIAVLGTVETVSGIPDALDYIEDPSMAPAHLLEHSLLMVQTLNTSTNYEGKFNNSVDVLSNMVNNKDDLVTYQANLDNAKILISQVELMSYLTDVTAELSLYLAEIASPISSLLGGLSNQLLSSISTPLTNLKSMLRDSRMDLNNAEIDEPTKIVMFEVIDECNAEISEAETRIHAVVNNYSTIDMISVDENSVNDTISAFPALTATISADGASRYMTKRFKDGMEEFSVIFAEASADSGSAVLNYAIDIGTGLIQGSHAALIGAQSLMTSLGTKIRKIMNTTLSDFEYSGGSLPGVAFPVVRKNAWLLPESVNWPGNHYYLGIYDPADVTGESKPIGYLFVSRVLDAQTGVPSAEGEVSFIVVPELDFDNISGDTDASANLLDNVAGIYNFFEQFAVLDDATAVGTLTRALIEAQLPAEYITKAEATSKRTLLTNISDFVVRNYIRTASSAALGLVVNVPFLRNGLRAVEELSSKKVRDWVDASVTLVENVNSMYFDPSEVIKASNTAAQALNAGGFNLEWIVIKGFSNLLRNPSFPLNNINLAISEGFVVPFTTTEFFAITPKTKLATESERAMIGLTALLAPLTVISLPVVTMLGFKVAKKLTSVIVKRYKINKANDKTADAVVQELTAAGYVTKGDNGLFDSMSSVAVVGALQSYFQENPISAGPVKRTNKTTPNFPM